MSDSNFLFFLVLQELVAANPNDRNWKGIIIALACIVLILASVAVSVVILTPPEEVSLLY